MLKPSKINASAYQQIQPDKGEQEATIAAVPIS
jgi:hypothetical protein